MQSDSTDYCVRTEQTKKDTVNPCIGIGTPDRTSNKSPTNAKLKGKLIPTIKDRNSTTPNEQKYSNNARTSISNLSEEIWLTKSGKTIHTKNRHILPTKTINNLTTDMKHIQSTKNIENIPTNSEQSIQNLGGVKWP